jgi:hypothetical protein
MEVDIDKEFNVPVKIDIEMGVSGDHMLECVIKDMSKYELQIEVEGSKESLDRFRNLLSIANMSHTCKVLEEKEKFVSNHTLFMKKKAFSQQLGKSRKVIEAHLSIFS